MSIGLRWYRFDFHKHTPASHDYAQPSLTDREWLLSYMNCQVDAVVISVPPRNSESPTRPTEWFHQYSWYLCILAHIDGPKGVLSSQRNLSELKATFAVEISSDPNEIHDGSHYTLIRDLPGIEVVNKTGHHFRVFPVSIFRFV